MPVGVSSGGVGYGSLPKFTFETTEWERVTVTSDLTSFDPSMGPLVRRLPVRVFGLESYSVFRTPFPLIPWSGSVSFGSWSVYDTGLLGWYAGWLFASLGGLSGASLGAFSGLADF